MASFDHILNWKLKAGSHEFPGPAGGTCINEAAIVAAGFPYRPIGGASDMPDCFSRVLAQALIWLNDNSDDADRQHLMWFVTRLAGTRGDDLIEHQRGEIIAVEIVRAMAALRLWRETPLASQVLRASRQMILLAAWPFDWDDVATEDFRDFQFEHGLQTMRTWMQREPTWALLAQSLSHEADWSGRQHRWSAALLGSNLGVSQSEYFQAVAMAIWHATQIGPGPYESEIATVSARLESEKAMATVREMVSA